MPGAPLKYLLRQRCPAEAERNGGLIKFALDGIDGAALVEAESLITEVQAGSLEAKTLVYAIAALNVKLCVCVEIDVAARAPESQDGVFVRCRVDVGVVVELYVGVVMARRKAHGEA